MENALSPLIQPIRIRPDAGKIARGRAVKAIKAEARIAMNFKSTRLSFNSHRIVAKTAAAGPLSRAASSVMRKSKTSKDRRKVSANNVGRPCSVARK